MGMSDKDYYIGKVKHDKESKYWDFTGYKLFIKHVDGEMRPSMLDSRTNTWISFFKQEKKNDKPDF